MDKQRILILDKERIDRKLQRMAYEIWENNSSREAVTFIGIEGSGLAVANDLAKRLGAISPLKVSVLPMKVNKRNPLSDEIKLEKDLGGQSVILVDDVANSGKTLLYAMKPLLNCEPGSIAIAVLVDRKHKSFPVSPDIVGHTVATTVQDHIEVETKDDEILAAYLQ